MATTTGASRAPGAESFMAMRGGSDGGGEEDEGAALGAGATRGGGPMDFDALKARLIDIKPDLPRRLFARGVHAPGPVVRSRATGSGASTVAFLSSTSTITLGDTYSARK